MYTNLLIIPVVIILIVTVNARVITTTGTSGITEFKVGVDNLNESEWQSGNVFVINERQCILRDWNFSVYSPTNQIGTPVTLIPAEGSRFSSQLVIQYISNSASGFNGGNIFFDNVVLGVYQYPQAEDTKKDEYQVNGFDYTQLTFGDTTISPSFFGNSGLDELKTYRAISFSRPYTLPCESNCFVAYRVITACDPYECGELNPEDVASHCCDGTAQKCTYQGTGDTRVSTNFTAYYTLIPKCDAVCPPSDPAPMEPPPAPIEIPAPIVEIPEPPPRIWGPPIIYGIPEPQPLPNNIISQITPATTGIIIGVCFIVIIIIVGILVGIFLYRKGGQVTQNEQPVYVDDGGKF